MRNSFADTLYELAKRDPNLCTVVADISPAGAMSKFREEFPKRFINVGVAEQIMIGLAAGMAQRGLKPFAYTIATFALYRALEFVRDDLCYQDLPVTVVGIGGGLTYSTLGATHHAQEDVSLACSIPNLQVVAPCDPLEVAEATRWLAQESIHPTYLRLGKAGEPVVTQAAPPWEFGKLRYLQKGTDLCILTYGPTITTALEVAKRVAEQNNWTVSVVSCHTLQPLDVLGIISAAREHSRLMVIEETSGAALGVRVRSVLNQTHIDKHVKVYQLCNGFQHTYGEHKDLLEYTPVNADYILGTYK